MFVSTDILNSFWETENYETTVKRIKRKCLWGFKETCCITRLKSHHQYVETDWALKYMSWDDKWEV